MVLLYATVVYVLMWQHTNSYMNAQMEADHELADQILDRVDRDGRVQVVATSNKQEERSGLLAEVIGPQGELLYESPACVRILGGGAGIPSPSRGIAVEVGRIRSVILADGRHFRVLDRRWDDSPLTLRVLRDESRRNRELSGLLGMELLSTPLVLLLAGLAGWGIAVRALAPVARMAEEAHHIAAERLDQRLPVENPDDELGHLATVLNQTFARLEGSFSALSRFTADASHELRTPLTAMRSVGEVGLADSRSAEQYRETIASMLEEVDGLTRLVDSLLVFSRSSGRPGKVIHEAVEVTALVDNVVGLLAPLADDKEQTIVVHGQPKAFVKADSVGLRQALVNLLDNAIKFSPPASAIEVVVGHGGGLVTIEVRDQGPGIAAQHLEHVFERFYRVDQARSRDAGGVGLGLAITRWVVESNGGTVQAESTLGQGCTFRIVLPAEASQESVR